MRVTHLQVVDTRQTWKLPVFRQFLLRFMACKICLRGVSSFFAVYLLEKEEKYQFLFLLHDFLELHFKVTEI